MKLASTEISLVKVVWGRASGKDATWELEGQMRDAYPTLFDTGKFRGQNFFLGGWNCNSRVFFLSFPIK